MILGLAIKKTQPKQFQIQDLKNLSRMYAKFVKRTIETMCIMQNHKYHVWLSMHNQTVLRLDTQTEVVTKTSNVHVNEINCQRQEKKLTASASIFQKLRKKFVQKAVFVSIYYACKPEI